MSDTQRSATTIHLKYVIGILGAVVIAVATIRFGTATELVAYLSFSLTVTSLVLGVLAIIYAFVSNTAIAENLGALRGISERMEGTTRSLMASTTGLHEQVVQLPSVLEASATKAREEMAGATEKLGESASELHQQVSTLPQVFDEAVGKVARDVSSATEKLAAATKELQGRIESVPTRLEAMDTRITQVLSQLGAERDAQRLTTDDRQHVLDQVADYMMTSASPNGLAVLYAATLAKQRRQNLDLLALSKYLASAGMSAEYAWGFLIAAASVPVLIIKVHGPDAEGQLRVYEVGAVLPKLLSGVAAALDAFDERQRKKGAPVSELRQKVERFFATTSPSVVVTPTGTPGKQ